MNFQRQTKFGGADAPANERGDCFAACVASILGVPVASLPNFCALGTDETWASMANEWLSVHAGVMLITYVGDPLIDAPMYGRHGVMIASGPAERGHIHCVLWRCGKLLHDPHPSNAGLLKADHFDLMVVLDADRLQAFVRSQEAP